MTIVKYPEWVEAQLKILDERIEEIYKSYADLKFRPDEAMRIKKNLYEQTKPFVDEKVRLITNCHPTYKVEISSIYGSTYGGVSLGGTYTESEEEQKAVNDLEKSTHTQSLNAVKDWLERDIESEYFKKQENNDE